MRNWIGGILMTALVASAAAGDAARPATAQPEAAANTAASGTDSSLPGPYRILLSRSIFAAGGKSSEAAAAPSPSAPPEASLALKGVVQDDQQFTAFVEDLPQKRVLQLKVGDAVARGRVVAITLHELQYQAAGRLTRVSIGQALGGPGVVTTVLPASAPPAPPAGSMPHHPSTFAEAR